MDTLCSSSMTQMNSIQIEKTNKRQIHLEDSNGISDEILEIRQIEYEQQLIVEEIDHINEEQKRLQDLLNLIQSSKSKNKKMKIKHNYPQVQSKDLNTECDCNN